MYKKRIVVDVSDAKVSTDPCEVLATYSLGSCIGLCLYEPKARVGGMLHFQLPDSKHDPQRANDRPFMYADTGTALLMNELLRLGANKRLIHAKIAGGAINAVLGRRVRYRQAKLLGYQENFLADGYVDRKPRTSADLAEKCVYGYRNRLCNRKR